MSRFTWAGLYVFGLGGSREATAALAPTIPFFSQKKPTVPFCLKKKPTIPFCLKKTTIPLKKKLELFFLSKKKPTIFFEGLLFF